MTINDEIIKIVINVLDSFTLQYHSMASATSVNIFSAECRPNGSIPLT